MDELIRKQDALDALMAERKHLLANGQKGAEHVLTHHGYNVIDELKPVQSDVPVINVGDMISRQAVMDALDVLCQEHRYKIPGKIETYSQYNEAWQDALDRAEGAIFNLPSAQPERTCVNCGRTANNGGWYADGGTRCPIEEHYALPKDGYCHLWEKRKDWEDDYVKRPEEGEK